MKKYRVLIDVTMTSELLIEAANKKEAKQKATRLSFTPSDLTTFWHTGNKVIEVQE